MSYQAGLRHIVSDLIQLDLTVGQGLAGANKLPVWYGIGVRLVTEFFYKKHSNSKSVTNDL